MTLLPAQVAPTVDPAVAVRVFVALGIGGLVGLEREGSDSGGTMAGSRTFPLVALLGAVTQEFFPDALPVVALALGGLLVAAYLAKVAASDDVGTTTTVALALTFVLGAMTTHSPEAFTLAVVLGTVTTALLAAKDPIHSFADSIDPAERRATLKFLIVALVVLPLLPDRRLPGLLGLNPRFVWLMVVLVSGISLVGYLLSTYVGPERGLGLTGLLGGVVSSTATAVSMAERTRRDPGLAPVCGFALVLAAVVMLPRAVVEVSVVNPALVPAVALPLGAMAAVGGAVAVGLYLVAGTDADEGTELRNPFRLTPALAFAAFFAVVLVAAERASVLYGEAGVYGMAVVSGLAGVDAMTLSLGRLSAEGAVPASTATVGIVLAVVSNTLVKAVVAWVLGTPRLGRIVTGALVAASVAGLAVALVA